MEEFFPLLVRSPLFRGISPEELTQMLPCLGAQSRTAQRRQILFQTGEPAQWVGLVLSGAVHIVEEDYYGNRSILATVEPPQLFGEAFACAGLPALPVSIEAAQDCQVLLLNVRQVTATCSDACAFHQRLVANLLEILAGKNLQLTRKVSLLSKRTTREKLITYFLEEAQRAGSPSFTLSYDRQTLADYLGVERSAMSAEISKLRKAGLLDCQGRQVTLHPSISPQGGTHL